MFAICAGLPAARLLCWWPTAGSILFTDGRYRTQAKEEVKDARIVVGAQISARGGCGVAGGAARKSAQLEVGIEPESITAGMRDRLVARAEREGAAAFRAAAGRTCAHGEGCGRDRAHPAGGRTWRQSLPDCLQEDSAGCDRGRSCCRHGIRGALCRSRRHVVPDHPCSGERSAIVHGRASGARIPRRGFVVCDFGVILAGYCSDRTRTVHVGRPSREARQLYEAVLEAQQAAIAAVRPG